MTLFRVQSFRGACSGVALHLCVVVLCVPLMAQAQEIEAQEPLTMESTEAVDAVTVPDAAAMERPDSNVMTEVTREAVNPDTDVSTVVGGSVDSDAPAMEQSLGVSSQTNEETETSTLLPRNLSPWGMFLDADIVVKAVMLGLVFASMVTWTVLMAKTLELGGVRRKLSRSASVLYKARSFDDVERIDGGIGRDLVEAALTEWRLSSEAPDKDGIKERIVSSLSRLEAGFARRLAVGTGLLATIGATAPFVGLFGTVWGIMNSFIGISQANTTNLAVVAPGIAEALLATALGLVAAIPAVVIYNHFARQIAGVKALVADQSAAVLRLISRDLDRDVAPRANHRAAS